MISLKSCCSLISLQSCCSLIQFPLLYTLLETRTVIQLLFSVYCRYCHSSAYKIFLNSMTLDSLYFASLFFYCLIRLSSLQVFIQCAVLEENSQGQTPMCV
ncbi:hypothetical protein QQ045_016656 [Rhodiola kirilowii]